MSFKRFLYSYLLILLGVGAFNPPVIVKAEEIEPVPAKQVSAYELILAMNTLRVSNGLPVLIEDLIVDAVAQNTASIMAANNILLAAYVLQIVLAGSFRCIDGVSANPHLNFSNYGYNITK